MRYTTFSIAIFLRVLFIVAIHPPLYAQEVEPAPDDVIEQGGDDGFTEPSCWQPICLSEENDEAVCFQLFRNASRLKFQGWVESGLYTNAHGAKSAYGPNGEGLLANSGNGPMFGPGLRSTNYNMNQLWASLTREMNCENGLDWGFQADLAYGMGGYDLQSYGDDSLDARWGQGDYALGLYQLYGEIGYGRLTARYGKFGTPIGWESVPSWDNFFYSHSYCYNIEPSSHTGALVKFQLTDGLELIGAWTAGMENGFANRYGDQGLLAGFELALTKKSSFYYYMTQGRQKNGQTCDNFDRFTSGLDNDYFIQSLCFEWLPAENLSCIIQYNLNNSSEVGGDRFSAYGVNNHLIYSLNDCWAVGLRAEWLRDNGVLAYENVLGNSNNSDYVQLTLGLNYNPTKNLRIRPEIRYDRSMKNCVFANGMKNEQLSGGFAVLYGF